MPGPLIEPQLSQQLSDLAFRVPEVLLLEMMLPIGNLIRWRTVYTRDSPIDVLAELYAEFGSMDGYVLWIGCPDVNVELSRCLSWAQVLEAFHYHRGGLTDRITLVCVLTPVGPWMPGAASDMVLACASPSVSSRLTDVILATTPQIPNHRRISIVVSDTITNRIYDTASFDTGMGCSTLLRYTSRMSQLATPFFNMTHGMGFNRMVLPRSGPLKSLGYLGMSEKQTLMFRAEASGLHGDGKRDESSQRFVDDRVLPGKRSRKAKTQDSADSADLQQMLAAFAEEEEAEEQKVLAEFADYDEDKEMSTPATSEAALEEEEEEAALEEDAAVTPPTPPAAPASDSLSSTPDLVAPTPDLAAPTPLPAASDEALSSAKVAPPT